MRIAILKLDALNFVVLAVLGNMGEALIENHEVERACPLPERSLTLRRQHVPYRFGLR